jgi:hypothetical protein
MAGSSRTHRASTAVLVVELQVTDSNDEQGPTDVAWEGCDGTEGWICRLEIREGAPLSVKATVTYE